MNLSEKELEEFRQFQQFKAQMQQMAGQAPATSGDNTVRDFREYQQLNTNAKQMMLAVAAHGAPQAFPQDMDTKEMCLANFLSMMEHMLKAIAFVFPECQKTKNLQDEFRLANNSKLTKAKLIESWHKNMQPFYQHVINRDEAALRNSNMSWFQKLDILTKWDDPGFTKESKDNMWACLEELNRYAGMYYSIEQIPPTVLTGIQNVASDVFTAFQEGGTKLDDLDLTRIGRNVVNQCKNPQEIQDFLKNMHNITQNLGGMENLMRVAQDGISKIQKQKQ